MNIKGPRSSSLSTHKNPYFIFHFISLPQFHCPARAEIASISTKSEPHHLWSCSVDHWGSNHAYRNSLEGWCPKTAHRFWLKLFPGHSSSRSSGRRHHLHPNSGRTYHRRGYFPGLRPRQVRPRRQVWPSNQDISAPRQGVRGYTANLRGQRPFSLLQSQDQRRGHSVFMLLRRLSRQKLYRELFGL